MRSKYEHSKVVITSSINDPSVNALILDKDNNKAIKETSTTYGLWINLYVEASAEDKFSLEFLNGKSKRTLIDHLPYVGKQRRFHTILTEPEHQQFTVIVKTAEIKETFQNPIGVLPSKTVEGKLLFSMWIHPLKEHFDIHLFEVTSESKCDRLRSAVYDLSWNLKKRKTNCISSLEEMRQLYEDEEDSQKRKRNFDRKMLHIAMEPNTVIFYDDLRKNIYSTDFHTVKKIAQKFGGNHSMMMSYICKDPSKPITFTYPRIGIFAWGRCTVQNVDPTEPGMNGLMFERSLDIQIRNAARWNWIKWQCLRGQDSEFNIFRSICFTTKDDRNNRLYIGLIALAIQIALCVGITKDIIRNWSALCVIDSDAPFKIIISILTFAFVLQRNRTTVESFVAFYENMAEVFDISRVVISLDFVSNIIVGFWMTALTPFFLLESEDIQTVVLNSFALAFFIELDDMANIFESDETCLLQDDVRAQMRGEVERIPSIRERHFPFFCTLYGKRQIHFEWMEDAPKIVGNFVCAPFLESYRIVTCYMHLMRYFVLKQPTKLN